MAISKKERAEFDAALLKAETFGALRWTSPVQRDVKPPTANYSEGWDFSEHSKKVWLGWSTSVSHGEGPAPKEGESRRFGSQNSRSMFSTKAKALAAMRHEIERMAAADLLSVDKMIAGVEASEQAANAGSES